MGIDVVGADNADEPAVGGDERVFGLGKVFVNVRGKLDGVGRVKPAVHINRADTPLGIGGKVVLE